MDIYRYTPHKKITHTVILSGLCIAVIAASPIVMPYIGTYMTFMLCLIFALTALLLTNRFILSTYTFILSDINFIIIRSNSQKSIQICNIRLHTAIEILEKKPLKKFEREFGKVAILKSYCQNLWAAKEYIYIFEFDNKILAIKFDADANFIDEMKKRIAEAKLRYGE